MKKLVLLFFSAMLFSFAANAQTVTLLTPTGGETVAYGDSLPIVWQYSGVTNVTLKYSTNGGSSYTTIGTYAANLGGIPGLGAYNWFVPAISSTICKVKVESAANSSISDVTAGYFSITLPASIAVTAPNGGENWQGNTANNITWNYNNLTSQFVNMYYSTDAGVSWNYITNTYASYQSYSWTPTAGINSTQCRVKVEEYNNASLFDISNANFTITTPIPVFTVTSPNGGETWASGTAYNITWTLANAPSGYLNLYYSTDAGVNWTNITYVSASTNSYSWTPTSGINSTQCRIKVQDYYDSNVYDISNANFTITSPTPTITVTTPNGGEVWQSNTYSNIYFTATNTLSGYVNLYYSIDGGVTWVYIAYASASQGYYQWYTSNISSNNCLIKIEDYSNAAYFDVSNAVFAIQGALPACAYSPSPASGVSNVGQSTNLTWYDGSGGLVTNYKVYFGTSSTPPLLTTVASSVTSYYVSSLALNTTYYWKIVATNATGDAVGCSTWSFSTSLTPTYLMSDTTTVTACSGSFYDSGGPSAVYNNSENYVKHFHPGVAGQSVRLTFNSFQSESGYDYLYLYDGPSTSSPLLATFNGSNFQSQITATNVTGELTVAWHSDGSQIYAGWDATISCTNNPGGLLVNYPNGGEYLCAGSTYNITWSASQINNINIQFSSDYGNTYTTIASNIAASLGTYAYTIPAALNTSGCYIRIVDAANTSTFDASNSSFTITPSTITTSNPYAGQTLTAGAGTYIYWSVGSCLSTTYLTLSYSTNGGSTWTNIATSVSANNGSYYWTVPNTPSTNCLVRVADGSNATIFGQTSGAFTIAAATPSLTLTTPSSGDVWNTNTGYYIYWTSANIANVKLSYSSNGGTSYTVITSNTPASNGYYYWTTPTTAASNFCIKVEDVTNSAINDANCGISLVVPTPTITSVNYPYQGQSFNNGSSMYISWTSANVANVKIELSTNGGTSYSTIVASTNASSQSYTWPTINSTASTNCKVRVSDVNNATVNAVSGVFTIVIPVPTITSVTAPYQGQVLTVATQQYIQWTSANVSLVKIELSTDGGTTYPTSQLVVASTSGTQQYYYWTVPNNPSTNCKIRVSDVANLTTVSAQSQVFTIASCAPTLTLTSPTNGQLLNAGSYTYIYWNSACVTNIRIEYSSNGGSTWSTVAASTSATTGYYYWGVPSTATTQGRIRITDLASGSTAVSTGTNFTIGTPTITVTSPNGAENWTGGTSHYITWTSTYNTNNYANLEYTIDNGATWNYINYAYYTGNSGSYQWTVPNTPSTQCKVRVSDYYNSTITDVSNALFTISQATPQITVTSPNGGENWAVGYSYGIYWNSISVNNVKIEYTYNGGSTWNTISSSYPASNGYYNWAVPNTASTNCWVRISDAANGSVTDMSNFAFSINTPSVTVTAPNGGEIWQGLTAHYITWNNTNTGVSTYVNIEYSTNNGASWNYIVYGTYNNNYYNWSVANVPSTQCLVRVTDYYNANVFDVSNATFTITAASTTLSLYAPNGGETFGVGSTQTISWYSQNISNVKLEYSTDGGLTYPNTIVASTPNSGYYYWTVPNTVTTQCRVRVSDAAVTATSSASAGNFTIVNPTITVTNPNGGQTYIGLTNQTINWTNTAVSNYVNLQYTTDNSNWTNITTLYNNAVTGTYTWQLPNVATTLARVRVVDYYNNAIGDMSDTTFTITLAPAALQITSPNGFESFAVSTQNYIQWNSTSITSVNLEYTTNGTTWTNIANNINTAIGYYLWTVPNTPSTTCKVRVVDANNSALSDASNNNFTIVTPFITVNSPNGGEVYYTGSGYYVQWTSSGVNNVAIELSTDGGTTYSTIVNSTYNNSYYWWSPVAANISTTCKIRVKDIATGATLSDASNANFTIQAPTPAITVTSPNGGENWTVGYNYYITWNSVGVNSVNIQYSTNGGTSWSTVVSGYTASNNYYSWNTPNTPSNNVWIKVSNAADTTLNDLSGQFNIVPNTPTLAITSPNGGENLQVGSYAYISWNSNNVGCVNLEVSYNGGTSWSVLAGNLTNNYYYWNIPNAASTQCWVRVTDCLSSLSDMSNAAFTISVPVANTNAITVTSLSDNVFCKGDTIWANYTATGVYNAGNTFSLQMSDATGSFANPTYIGGNYATTLVDSVWGTIPATSANSTLYKVRVVSNNLVATSAGSVAFAVQGPTADFTAYPYQSLYLLPQDASIQFLPTTTGSVASYAWTFGDGGTATNQSPTHFYGSTVLFDIQLTVTDSNGCSAVALKPQYIHTEYYLENTDVMPQGFTGTVTGASFVNNNVGCFTLSTGNCYVTTNGGYNWTHSVTGLPTGTGLTSASLIAGYWVIAGNNGTLSYSTNQGATWIPYYTGTTASFNGVSMASATSGFAVGSGGTVCIYNGTSWASSTIAGTSGITFNGVATYGTNGALTVGSGGSIYYYNGTTWAAITSAIYNSSYNFTSVYTDIDSASSAIYAYATANNGSIIRLDYSGTAWTASMAISGTGVAFAGISGRGTDIYAVGDSGIVYHSFNQGSSFGRYSVGGTSNLRAAAYKKPRGWVGGDGGTGKRFGPEPDTTNGTGIINVDALLSNLSIYPNPAKNTLSIVVGENNNSQLQITIKDVAGRNIMDVANEKVSGTFKKEVNVSQLASGTYFVFVTQNGKQVVSKLTIND